MGIIHKYLLPKEIDFNRALKKQVDASRNCVLDLCLYCQKDDRNALKAILEDEHQSRALKRKNMHELLDVFITPYDKESIYRIITQLDWISLSVKHLVIELLTYKIDCPDYYKNIFKTLAEMVLALDEAFDYLPQKKLGKILTNIEMIHDHYDETTKYCAIAAVKHLNDDDTKVYLAHKEILNQLKEVSKRIHTSANTLEDMAMKII